MTEIIDSQKKNGFKGWPMIVFWGAMIVFAGHACTHMVAAGDTWVAMACGRHFVNHGVDTVEPFSANSHKAGPTDAELQKYPEWQRPIVRKMHPTGWINQNWLTHVIFYTFATTFGSDGEYNYDGLVYWKFIVTFLAVVCTFYTSRVLGVSRPVATIAACFAIFIGRSFIDIRPAVFSNLIVPLYLLILMLATYRNIRYIWLIVPVIVFWSNVHGGYIYSFMMLVPFIGLHFIAIPSKKLFVTIGFKGVVEVVCASITAFVAMIIFNPFHLTNLTHTFEVSISKHAESWRTVNEWHPAFEWDNPVGDEQAFLVMFILMWTALAAWIVARILKPRTEIPKKRARQNVEPAEGSYEWPRIDLAYIAIAMFTIYLAVKSRRFIPLAGVAGCPMIALFCEQAGKMISARVQFNKTRKLSLPEMPIAFSKTIILGFAVVVIGFGTVWGAKFKRIYLDTWPNDDVRDSVFMRMTASNVKPFEVMQFVRDNKLSGTMFNHWTEGGAVAFGQEPDPETGFTPLKLFMDGRAQAAYNHDKFLLWQYIKSGGPAVRNAKFAKRKLKGEDFKKIGIWVDEQLKKYNAWVILMPINQINSDFMIGVQTTTNWRMAFLDNHQFLMINIDTPQGKKLLTEILNEKAKYPNEYTQHLALAKNLLLFQNPVRAKQGLDHAIKAFEIENSQAPMQLLVHDAARRHRELRAQANNYIKQYLDKFIANHDEYATQGGYTKKLVAAMIAANYLTPQSSEYRKKYGDLEKAYKEEQREIGLRGRW